MGEPWMRRVLVAAMGSGLIASSVLAGPRSVPGAGATGALANQAAAHGPDVGVALDAGTSPAVRSLPRSEPSGTPAREGPAHRSSQLTPGTAAVADPVVQTATPTVAAPTPSSFEGTGNIDAVVPPDTDLAVGPNHVVELVNTHYQVFNKSGATLAGPIESAKIWSAFSASTSAAKYCYSAPGGDGIVLYDRAADRWVISELAFPSVFSGPFIQCFAVSQSNDPTGSYFVYAFLMSNSSLPDYPKIGIWGNSYFLSANMFSSPFASSSDPEVWAFDRSAMLAGPTNTVHDVTFAGYVPSTYNTILPADVDGATPPPSGSPEVFAGLDFATNTTLGLWYLSVDWATPGGASFSTSPTTLAVAPYNTLCGGSQNCLPQPKTSQTLDAISDRVMYRLAYRNFGDHEALVVNHSVNAATNGTQAGVRWYEIDRALANGAPSGTFNVAQQGTYAPDSSTNRWMGSAAMNRAGDIALGYSATSASLNPSIQFTGQVKSQAVAGQMNVSEGVITPGGGSQTGYNRWGDYTRMAVDPTDDCTFWYAGEYYGSSSASNWQTRIGSFQLSPCSTTADFSLSVNPSSQTTAQGTTSAPYTVLVNPSGGFSSSVTLSVSGVPSGATATFNPQSTSTSAALTIAAAATTPTGTYPLTITGTSGTLTHTVNATLVVNPAGDFTVTAAPSSQTVVQGSPTSYNVTVTPSSGFTSMVNLAASGLPAGAAASFNPTSLGGGTSTMSVTTASNTPPGTYTLTVTGTSGTLTHSTTVSLVVTASTAGTVMHISEMKSFWQVKSSYWVVWGDATVLDQNNQPVQGATVTFTLSGGPTGTATCVTNSSGYCSSAGNKIRVSLSYQTVMITITNVTKTGATWDGVKWGAAATR